MKAFIIIIYGLLLVLSYQLLCLTPYKECMAFIISGTIFLSTLIFIVLAFIYQQIMKYVDDYQKRKIKYHGYFDKQNKKSK